MKNRHYSFLMTLVLTVTFGIANAQTLKVDRNVSEIKASGTSSLHDWEMPLTLFESSTTLKNGQGSSYIISGTQFSGKAASIESDKSIMTKKAREALKADKNPLIIFKQTEDATANLGKGAAPVEVKGNLTIAGITRPVKIEAIGQKIGDDEFKTTATIKIKMSDFKMDPPTAMLGAIKTDDEVIIHLDMTYDQLDRLSSNRLP